MVSIRKLAELAGVSHVTVWRALRGKPGVNPQVLERILALAAAHHYHPNRLAEGFFSGKTRTIGLVVENLPSYFYSRMCNGVMEAAFADRVHVITLNMYGINGEPRQLSLLISLLIEQRVDGIIIASGLVPVPAQLVFEMWSHDIVPVVLCDTPSEKPLDRVQTDERRLTQMALEYLWQLGHRRIIYCGYDPMSARNYAMKQAFLAHGIPLEYFIEKAHIYVSLPEQADEYLDAFCRMPAPPTAITCFDDHQAMQLLLRAQRRGWRVPDDVSIIGCGNDCLGCALLTPTLTSIEQNPEEIGARAYAVLQRRQREGDAPSTWMPETICVPPTLVTRESCAPLHERTPVSRVAADGSRSRPKPAANCPPTTEVTTDVHPPLARILAACSGALSKRELMLRLGLRNEKHFRVAYLTPALDSGYLERTIPDKPRSSQQCYRLTARGLKEKGMILL